MSYFIISFGCILFAHILQSVLTSRKELCDLIVGAFYEKHKHS